MLNQTRIFGFNHTLHVCNYMPRSRLLQGYMQSLKFDQPSINEHKLPTSASTTSASGQRGFRESETNNYTVQNVVKIVFTIIIGMTSTSAGQKSQSGSEVTSVRSEVTLAWSEVTSIMEQSGFWWGQIDWGQHEAHEAHEAK